MTKDEVLDALRAASKGLVYTSETDASLEAFAWKGADTLTDAKVRELAGVGSDVAVEHTTLDKFFHMVPSEDRKKFQKLTHALQQQLTGIKVYKVGDEPEKQAYIVGKTKDGRWAGLKTTVVET
jgi:histidine triad (HIT) family protein